MNDGKSNFEFIFYSIFSSTPKCLNLNRNFSISSVVASSAAVETTKAAIASSIPEVPSVPSLPSAPLEEITNVVNALGEPTFASLGLGGWSPIGLLQLGLEYIHVTLDVPWWATIAISTIIIRTLLTPIVVITQRNAAHMKNSLPEMQETQAKITEARAMGNALEYTQANQELMGLMKRKGFNPIKNMLIPMAQMPIFLSYFIGIRRMVNAPVESLHVGGLLWFTDLTLKDPYYILPLVTCTTLALTIRLGTEVGANMNTTANMTNLVLKLMPIIVFPFIMNFPAATVVYWCSSNLVSLIQVFRIFSTYFNTTRQTFHH